MPDPNETVEVIQRAIDEWATIAGGPSPTQGGPTLARYIADKLTAARGVQVVSDPDGEIGQRMIEVWNRRDG